MFKTKDRNLDANQPAVFPLILGQAGQPSPGKPLVHDPTNMRLHWRIAAMARLPLPLLPLCHLLGLFGDWVEPGCLLPSSWFARCARLNPALLVVTWQLRWRGWVLMRNRCWAQTLHLLSWNHLHVLCVAAAWSFNPLLLIWWFPKFILIVVQPVVDCACHVLRHLHSAHAICRSVKTIVLLWPLWSNDEQLVDLPIRHLPFRFFIPRLRITVTGRTANGSFRTEEETLRFRNGLLGPLLLW